MNQQHWSDEDLLAHLYGVGPQNSHLQDCDLCASRAAEWQRRRLQLAAVQPEVSADFLAAQRRRILDRLAGKPRAYRLWRPVPSLALAMAVLLAILWLRPVSQLPAPVAAPAPAGAADVTDTQVFQKVYTQLYNWEPRAVEPVRSLFEVNK